MAIDESIATDIVLRENAPFSEMTTIGVGGPASLLADVAEPALLEGLLLRARAASMPVFVLGEGSNLVVADRGFPGLVLRSRDTSFSVSGQGDAVSVRAGAGVNWDLLVAETVSLGLQGIECLAGIPGLAGAAPIQNVGAYGQEVGDTLKAVYVVERMTGLERRLSAADCGLGYRSSRFKAEWRDRFVVTGVELTLRAGAPPCLAYPELQREVDERCPGREPTVADVRDAVLAIRARKSMLLDLDDPNGRSAGSFFTNPVVPDAEAARVTAVAEARDLGTPPRYPAGEGLSKLSAAWLIQRAGCHKGWGEGRAGLSERHVLAIVNRGGATAADILATARAVRRKVQDAFAITLVPEPTLLGFEPEELEDLV